MTDRESATRFRDVRYTEDGGPPSIPPSVSLLSLSA
jgi:hypothetical protein